MAGIIVSIKDLVVRVQFDTDSPDINELLIVDNERKTQLLVDCLLYTSPSPRDRTRSRMPSSA